MRDDDSIHGLLAEIAELKNSVRRREELGHQRARSLHLLGILGVGTVLGVAAFAWIRVCAEWDGERVRDSFTHEFEELMPLAREELTELGSEVLPLLAEQGRAGLEERWPEISEELKRQSGLLADGLAERAERTGIETRDRILREGAASVLAAFPVFEDPVAREELERYVEDSFEDALASALADFEQRFDAQLEGTRNELAAFDTTRPEDTNRLQRRFIQLWLQLLEEEVASL